MKVVLFLLQNPFFEENEIKCMLVLDVVNFQPLNEIWEILRDLLPNEYPIDCMTTKYPHFDLVFEVIVNVFVQMNLFKNV